MSAHRPLKFIHCADLRLDSPFEGVQALEPEVADVLLRATFSAMERVVETAVAEECDFVVIAGNVYEAKHRSLQAQLRFAAAMRRLADHGIPCFVAHGPADPLSAWEAAVPLPNTVHRFPAGGDSVPVLRDGEQVAQVCGQSWPTASGRPDLAASLGHEPGGPFTVAVAHLPVQSDDALAVPEVAGVDFWALGGGEAAVGRRASSWVARCGPPQGLSAAEAGLRGCQVVTVSEDGSVSCRMAATAAVLWFDESLDVSECGTREDVIDAAFTKREEVRSLAGGVPALWRLSLVGQSRAAGALRRLDPERDLAAQMRDGEGERPDFVWLAALTLAAAPAVDLAQRRMVEDLAGDFLRSGQRLREAPSPGAAIRQVLAAHPEQRAVATYLSELSTDDLLTVLADAEALGLELLLGEAR